MAVSWERDKTALALRALPGLLVLSLLAAGIACTAFNPSFVEQLGGSPINSLPPASGQVIISLLNNTAFRAELRATVNELDGFSGEDRIESNGNSFFATSTDCEIAQIIFTQVTVMVTDDMGGTMDEEVTLDQNTLVGGINFGCGNIVVVTLNGTPGNFTATITVR